MRDTVPIFLRPRQWPWARRLAALARWLLGLLRAVRRRRREATAALTVGVDIASLYEPLTGIGWYLYQLLDHLKDEKGLRLRLYGPYPCHDPNAPLPQVALPNGPAIEWVRYPLPPAEAPAAGLWDRLLRGAVPVLVAADANAALFAPNYLAPPAFRLSRQPLVATVHDLVVERLPWAVRPDSRVALEARLARTWREASWILTPSQTVREEIIARGHFDPERIRAVHHGPGQAATAAPGALPPGVAPPFGLAVGTVEPRKNLATLLRAWRGLAAEARPQLVLCGQLGWAGEALRREIHEGTAEGWLLPTGYVDLATLVSLYHQASVVAFPSFYEGFGLPAIEALASCAPLVASDIPVLREVAGDAALYAAPQDPAAWTAAISRLLSEPDLAAELRRRGAERARAFTWPAAARDTLAVLRQAAG